MILVTLLGMSFSETMIGDTLIIHPITFDTHSPEGWNAQYKETVQFPDLNEIWRKIYIIQTLKCDERTKGDKYPCGEWDYIWNIFVNVPAQDSVEVYSLGSFVTPYGKRLWLGGEAGWQWSYDVTDYAPLLTGNREITVGNNQELLDLKFIFIKGTPERTVIDIENIYPYGHHSYGDLADDLVLKEKSISLHPDASGYKFRTVISGHGHAGPRNCCEWDSKNHTYYMNGWEIFRWNIWKDCGNNPIYPQGGTWPFDRAGWCPGTKVDEFEFELTPFVAAGDTIMIDYGIEPYKDNGEKDGEFRQSHQLVTYGPPNFVNDAEIVDILVPSSNKEHSRLNPSLSSPTIKVKNTGKNDIKTIEIHYGLKGRKKTVYVWHGELSFLDKETIILPNLNWNGLRYSKTFEVEIVKVNGDVDDNILNNKQSSIIAIPVLFPREFKLKIKTNNINRARENSFSIYDSNGKMYYGGDNFKDSTEYVYDINLDRGIYEFLMKDSMEDGMSVHWWYRGSSPDLVGIDGQVQFLTSEGELLYEFKPDFGQELRLQFIVGSVP